MTTEISKTVLNNICKKVMISIADLHEDGRVKETRKKKIIVCKLLQKRGYSVSAIARAVNKHHSTVLNMIDDEYRARRGLRPNAWIMTEYNRKLSAKTEHEKEAVEDKLSHISERFRNKKHIKGAIKK